jgi:hypothetical protein
MNNHIISSLEYLFSNRNKNVASLIDSNNYQNMKINQLNVETLIDISNDLIKNKRYRA